MTEYYDIILGLIPVTILGLGGGLQFVGVSQTPAVAIGGLAAVGMVVHAMFVKAPVDEPTTEQHARDSTGSSLQAAD